MATSGSVDFDQTRNEIILDALALIGVYGIGRTVSAEDMTFTANMLNKMIKTYQSRGLSLWSKEEAYLFIEDNTGEYTLSSASTSARMALRENTKITYLTTAASATDTEIVVNSTAGITAADIIGVVDDEDNVNWSTVASVDSSTGITLDDAIANDSAVNNNVYTLSTRINKPLRVLSMRRVTGGPAIPSSIPMMAISHEEYFDLPNKENNGNPTHFYYQSKNKEGKLYMWARPDDPNMYFEVTFERQLEDFDAASDTPDFPSEWLECLTYNLAIRIASGFGKANKIAELAPIAKELYEMVSNFDTEVNSISMMPEVRG